MLQLGKDCRCVIVEHQAAAQYSQRVDTDLLTLHVHQALRIIPLLFIGPYDSATGHGIVR